MKKINQNGMRLDQFPDIGRFETVENAIKMNVLFSMPCLERFRQIPRVAYATTTMPKGPYSMIVEENHCGICAR